jgi:hypothetical protein
MSLINDALKRASQAQPPPPPVEAPPPVQAAEHKSPIGWLVIVLPVLLLFIVALAGWFVFKGWQAGRQLSANRVSLAARETAGEEPSTDYKKGQPISPSATSTSDSSKSQAGKVVTAGSVTNTELTALEPTKPSPPVFKLQGIFYRPARPSAMVNSKTVFVGDKVATARILAIGRESVTLECEGQTKVLTLE